MILHYGGKYTDDSVLPKRNLPVGSVKFREPESMEELGKKAAAISVPIFILLAATPLLLGTNFKEFLSVSGLLGVILSLVFAPIHEILHAVCFKEDVYLFTDLKRGMLFVIGTESMTRGRFIFMSILPNLILGFLPYLFFLYHKEAVVPGAMGIMAVPMGTGDYLNIWNALCQMPKGTKTFLSGMNSYWYREE